MAEWFRELDLKSGGPWFKFSTLLLSGFVLGCPEFNSSTSLCKYIANWSASHQSEHLPVKITSLKISQNVECCTRFGLLEVPVLWSEVENKKSSLVCPRLPATFAE